MNVILEAESALVKKDYAGFCILEECKHGNLSCLRPGRFVGRAVVNRLVAEGNEVYVLNRGNHPTPREASN